MLKFHLGNKYDLGEGVPEHYKQCTYHLSANLGNAEAQASLGSMYSQGEGEVSDQAKATQESFSGQARRHIGSTRGSICQG